MEERSSSSWRWSCVLQLPAFPARARLLRTYDKKKVDFVIDGVCGIEVKAAEKSSDRDAKSLVRLRNERGLTVLTRSGPERIAALATIAEPAMFVASDPVAGPAQIVALVPIAKPALFVGPDRGTMTEAQRIPSAEFWAVAIKSSSRSAERNPDTLRSCSHSRVSSIVFCSGVRARPACLARPLETCMSALLGPPSRR